MKHQLILFLLVLVAMALKLMEWYLPSKVVYGAILTYLVLYILFNLKKLFV
jgi:hypothetical protein